MEQAFKQIIEKQGYWRGQDRVLVAVSGGVDSMVLLALLQRLPQYLRPAEIGVAHFNHHLRVEADDDAQAVANYCQQHQLSFYLGEWLEPTSENGIEAAARQARYDFLLATAKEQQYDMLLTAHHGDDQVETLLIKLIRGSSLQNMVGIRPVSWREDVKIVRPLLAFNKASIENWATNQHVPYWEDASNQQDNYLRNRVRHHLVPQIANEAPHYVEKWADFTNQLNLANDLIKTRVSELYPQCVVTVAQQLYGEQLDLLKWREFSEAERYFLLSEFFQRNLIAKGGTLSQRQLQQMISDLTTAGEQVWTLADNWCVQKSYHFLKLSNQQLSPSEKIAGSISQLGDQFTLPNDGLLMLEETQKLTQERDEVIIPLDWLPLTVRSYEPGDRFVLDASGQTKKVSRLFIDKKISKTERLNIPLVLNRHDEVVWIVGFRKSYLSIVPETDKIFYKLTYYKR
ncbi:tRNA lysidine(34) synthetase TilS [Vagococcus zengguangii]|uniref:tRNA(Ile)-lysidine synthase n=1 Tax=Vagococcus zengguangii TaxID=2571750 RepID=A0A4D7CXF2_9ENTE|nr:tRNA lysidine(34) synthetase TilS [Vagococcus zengguangii]QCI87121.1 tRNA lysidine(34) synthetase TilS [Vagococcus zengguangii]TLG80625.1 tRNA lysidine(34) synthetase TilS [Vagococcus zengguangii]